MRTSVGDSNPLSQEVQQIIAHLIRGTPEEQEEALQAIRRIGPPALRELLPLMAERKQMTARFLKRAACFSFLLPFLCSFVMDPHFIAGVSIYFPDLPAPDIPSLPIPTLGEALLLCFPMSFVWGLVGLLLGVLSVIMYRLWLEREARRMGVYLTPGARKRALAALAQVENSRVAGILIDALEPNAFHASPIREAVEAALTRLLPHLKAIDILTLKSRWQTLLCAELRRDTPASPNAAFKIAILEAFAQHGNSQVVPDVERWANRTAPTDLEREVMQAALPCLAALRARAEDQRATQTLLRPSSSTSASTPDVLLRPASGKNAENPQQLLRAGQAEESTIE